MIDFLQNAWPLVAGVLTVILTVIASAHAVLHKRDVRAAVGWVGLILLVPFFGAVIYLLLGVNRIRRRATQLRREQLRLRASTEELSIERRRLTEILPPGSQHLAALGELVDRVTQVPLRVGNQVDPLINGDEAYPAMIEAINAAETSVALCTYIFDNDLAGQMFADALSDAHQRGVLVRILIDAVGAWYSWPPIVRSLRKRNIPVARFLHSALPWRMPYINLRSHRKILVVDGITGYTGGLNIRTAHIIKNNTRSPVQDVHFRVRGPVVEHMMHVFAEDWLFSRKERLEGDAWFPPLEPVGPVVARGIADGPDVDLDKLRWAILGALARAKSRVRIVTPYFLPDQTLITSLNVASMRGVAVDIVLPSVNNLPYVAWAANAQLWQVLARGCRVFYTPAPFDHSKIMVVDGAWSLIGSANWDPRSLRLNFEFNLECYDTALASVLEQIIDLKLEGARELTYEEVQSYGTLRRLRDGIFRLAAPYL